MDLAVHLPRAVEAIREWEARWGPARVGSVYFDEPDLEMALEEYVERLHGNYPFFHPRYAGQMLKPPHPVAALGYLAAMLINPNNHALDGGPPTSAMEKEVVSSLSSMFGFPAEALGHLTSSGTIANLEAVWVARELHPGKAVAFSDQAHYTHGRLGEILRVNTHVVPSDDAGCMRLDVLEPAVRDGRIGTVVMTAGSTGLGAVDPIADVLEWRDRYGIRVHVDAAYGGFFALLASEADSPLGEETRRHLRAIGACDSVVIDPHKHGLQPYGCGCILFRDPTVGRVYSHDSPYTYFTSDELHLGEISFECSRAGAAAGALWFTLRLLPLGSPDGLRASLAAGLRAARSWYEMMVESELLRPFMPPELDILTYFPAKQNMKTSELSEASQAVLERGMQDPEEPFFLSLLRVEADRLARRHSDVKVDTDDVRVLRSVLMKPEHEGYVRTLHQLVSRTVAYL